jgi:hypothetical protein
LNECETRSLTLREEHRLRVFENRGLMRISWPKRKAVTGGWRKLHNEELHNSGHDGFLLYEKFQTYLTECSSARTEVCAYNIWLLLVLFFLVSFWPLARSTSCICNLDFYIIYFILISSFTTVWEPRYLRQFCVWLRVGRSGFYSRQGQRIFLQAPASHPASYPVGTGCPFPRGKARPGRDDDHSPPSSAG